MPSSASAPAHDPGTTSTSLYQDLSVWRSQPPTRDDGWDLRIVDISQLTRDAGVQPREALNRQVVSGYAELLEEQRELPPGVCFEDGDGNRHVADSFHRLEAAEQATLQQYPMWIRPGTRRDAVLFAAGANSKHGLRLTSRDKRRVVTRLLEDDEWSSWADREIARHCGVSNTLVSKIRRELSVNGAQMEESKRRVRRGGKTYQMDTDGIGRRGEGEGDEEGGSSHADAGSEEQVASQVPATMDANTETEPSADDASEPADDEEQAEPEPMAEDAPDAADDVEKDDEEGYPDLLDILLVREGVHGEVEDSAGTKDDGEQDDAPDLDDYPDLRSILEPPVPVDGLQDKVAEEDEDKVGVVDQTDETDEDEVPDVEENEPEEAEDIGDFAEPGADAPHPPEPPPLPDTGTSTSSTRWALIRVSGASFGDEQAAAVQERLASGDGERPVSHVLVVRDGNETGAYMTYKTVCAAVAQAGFAWQFRGQLLREEKAVVYAAVACRDGVLGDPVAILQHVLGCGIGSAEDILGGDGQG